MTPIDGDFPVDGELDLALSLRLAHLWGSTAHLKVDHTGAWYGRFTDDGPATVQMVLDGDRLLARSWGPGARIALEDVPALAGLHDPGLANLRPEHAAVEAFIKKNRGYRQVRTNQIYTRLVTTALFQKVTSKGAHGAYARLVRNLGSQAPGPREDLWLPPAPEVLAKVPYYTLHDYNIERRRADLIRRIAEGAYRLEEAVHLPAEAAHAHLQTLSGVGPWTAAVTLSSGIGDPDAVPFGDYHLKNWVSWNLAGEPRATDERMEELLAPYLGDRGRVARMVKASGSPAPRYGPKTAVRDIRGL